MREPVRRIVWIGLLWLLAAALLSACDGGPQPMATPRQTDTPTPVSAPTPDSQPPTSVREPTATSRMSPSPTPAPTPTPAPAATPTPTADPYILRDFKNGRWLEQEDPRLASSIKELAGYKTALTILSLEQFRTCSTSQWQAASSHRPSSRWAGCRTALTTWRPERLSG